MKVIMAKDSAFIPTLKDGDFSLCPLRSYKLKDFKFNLPPKIT